MTKPISWILLILTLACSALADEHRTPAELIKAAEDPAIAGLCCMEGGFCGPTSWRMNFALEGTQVDASTLYNLGWNYGFEFDENPGGPVAWPTTYPLEQTEHASELMGVKMEKHIFPMDPTRDRSNRRAEAKLAEQCRETATKQMIEALDAGKPVVVHWTPHLVLAYGHRGDKILFHDPLDTTVSREEHAGYVALGVGKGVCQAESTKEWTQGIRSWQEMGCPFYVFEKDKNSTSGPDNIPWKEIYERNAQRTLGIPGVGGNVAFGSPNQHWGIAAIRKFAEKIESIFPREPERYGEWGHLGYSSRVNAAEFLKKKHREETDPATKAALKTAADSFALSADLFLQAKGLAGQALGPGADRQGVASKLKEKLLAIADVEQEGGIALMAASGKPVPSGFEKKATN